MTDSARKGIIGISATVDVGEVPEKKGIYIYGVVGGGAEGIRRVTDANIPPGVGL